MTDTKQIKRSPRLDIGARLEVDIEAIDERGQGIATHAGVTILVPGLFPGERGEVEVEGRSQHKPLAHAWPRTRVRSNPGRRELPCTRHQDQHEREIGRTKPACAGCPLMALEIPAQHEAKRAWVAREHGLEVDALVAGDEFGYRWSSKRVVSGRPGRLVLGSRVASRRRRDWVADMRGCVVDHPLIDAALGILEDRANQLEIEPWQEDRGDLRYVWAKTNGEAVVITLITGAAESRAARELGPWLVEHGSHAGHDIIVGVAQSVQGGASNVIRGEDTHTIAGEVELELRSVMGVSQHVGPLGFLQPNPQVAALAYADLVGPAPSPESSNAGPESGPPHRVAIDLYAGAGVTTALLRERFDEVVPCESYPESAAALGVAAETAELFCERWRSEGRAVPDLIVANPPRAGLGQAVCASLLAIGAERVQIMSCNPGTLRADLDRLAVGYELMGLRGYDTLPQTPHVELVAWLRRR